MDKLSIHGLVLEFTRRCNLQCSHCLRGDAEYRDMPEWVMEEILKQVGEIGTLSFGGGESALAVPAIKYFRRMAEKAGLCVGGFYCATNAPSSLGSEFVVELLRWYAMCEDKESCLVQFSNDCFHEEARLRLPDADTELLEGLRFFKRKNKDDDFSYGSGANLLKMGRSEGGREVKIPDIDTVDDFNDEGIYVNVKGDVIPCCDLSYEEQDKHVLCSIEELRDFYNSLEK